MEGPSKYVISLVLCTNYITWTSLLFLNVCLSHVVFPSSYFLKSS